MGDDPPPPPPLARDPVPDDGAPPPLPRDPGAPPPAEEGDHGDAEVGCGGCVVVVDVVRVCVLLALFSYHSPPPLRCLILRTTLKMSLSVLLVTENSI